MSAEAKGSFLTCRALAHIIFSETGDEEDTMAGNHPTERGVKCTGMLVFDLKRCSRCRHMQGGGGRHSGAMPTDDNEADGNICSIGCRKTTCQYTRLETLWKKTVTTALELPVRNRTLPRVRRRELAAFLRQAGWNREQTSRPALGMRRFIF